MKQKKRKMRTNWKKRLASVLCLTTVMSAFPADIYAANEFTDASINAETSDDAFAESTFQIPEIPADSGDKSVEESGDESFLESDSDLFDSDTFDSAEDSFLAEDSQEELPSEEPAPEIDSFLAADSVFEEDLFSSGEGEADLFGDGSAELFESSESGEEMVLAGEVPSGEALPLLGDSSQVSRNLQRQNYAIWSSPITSYLCADASGYLRVEAFTDGILAERYDSGFLLQSQKWIPRQLSLFGGFYNGSDAFYLVFGQNNTGESDSAEVIRVVKYDKNWNQIDAAHLFGENTTYPFEAGSLRMTEYGGYLYVRTSHKMYTTDDGLNHQANLTFQIRTSDMEVTDCFSKIWNVSSGYVSHSFNQFILADDAGNLVTLDHGDAGDTRAAVLGRYTQKAGESTFIKNGGFRRVNVLNFHEPYSNSTGASLGGLEYSSTHYLTAGDSVIQDENWSTRTCRNIFVTSTSRSGFTKNDTSFFWITNYTEESGLHASTPQMVKLSSDRFLVIWDVRSGNSYNGTISYIFVDRTGTPVSSIFTANGALSDCKPAVSGQKAVWYITDGEKLTFCSIDSSGVFHSEVGHLHNYEPSMEFEKSQWTCGLVEGSIFNPLTTNSDGTVSWSSDNTGVAVPDASGKITLKGLGSCTITASASAGIHYRARSVSYRLEVLNLKKQTLQVQNPSVVYGDAPFSLSVSREGGAALHYRSENPEIASVDGSGIVTIHNAGTAKITVRSDITSEYASASVQAAVTVLPRPLSATHFFFKKTGRFPGSEIEKYLGCMENGKTLEKNKDYSLSSSSYDLQEDGFNFLHIYVYGKGNYTGSFQETISPIRQQPQLNTATLTDNGAALSWEQETGAVGYYIYRKMGTGSYEQIQIISDYRTVQYTDPQIHDTAVPVSYCIRAYTLDDSGSVCLTDASAALTPLRPQKITARDTYTVTYGDGAFSLNASALGKVPLTYVSDNTSVLTVSAAGKVTIKNAGSAAVTIRAAQTGEYSSASKTVSVTVKPKDISSCHICFNKVGKIPYAGDKSDYLTVVDTSGAILKLDTDYYLGGYTCAGSNSNLTYLSQHVYGVGNYTGYCSQILYPIEKARLSSVVPGSGGITIKWEKQTGAVGYRIYRKEGNGQYKTVKTITNRDILSWKDTSAASIHTKLTYCIKAYTKNGSKTSFTAASPAKSVIPLSACKITLSASSFTYSGKAQKPSVTVSYGSSKLKSGTHYTIAYKNNTNAGTASVVITGKGSYFGSVTKTFKINKAAQPLAASLSASAILIGKTSTVKASKAKGKITYSSDNTKIAKVSSNGKITGVSKGTAVIKVKAAATANYKAVSKSLRITVKKNISACQIRLSQTSFKYTGKAITPKVTVKDGSTTLKLNKDYTLTYSNNKKAGTASVTITGKGYYSQRVKKTFQITKAAKK